VSEVQEIYRLMRNNTFHKHLNNHNMKTKIEIKNRFTGKLIFEFETEENSVRKTVLELLKIAKEKNERVNLSGVDLSGVDLSGVDLLRFKSDIWRVLLYRPNEISASNQSCRSQVG